MANAEVQIAASGTIEPGPGEPGRQVTRGEDRVVGQHQERALLVDESLQEFGRAGQGVLLPHQDAVHVGEPAHAVRVRMSTSVASRRVARQRTTTVDGVRGAPSTSRCDGG